MNPDRFALTATQIFASGGGYHLTESVRAARQAALEAGDETAAAEAEEKLEIISEIEDRITEARS